MRIIKSIILFSALFLNVVASATGPKPDQSFYGVIENAMLPTTANTEKKIATFNSPMIVVYKNHEHNHATMISPMDLLSYAHSHRIVLLPMMDMDDTAVTISAKIHSVTDHLLRLNVSPQGQEDLEKSTLPLTFALIPKGAKPSQDFMVWMKGIKIQQNDPEKVIITWDKAAVESISFLANGTNNTKPTTIKNLAALFEKGKPFYEGKDKPAGTLVFYQGENIYVVSLDIDDFIDAGKNQIEMHLLPLDKEVDTKAVMPDLNQETKGPKAKPAYSVTYMDIFPKNFSPGTTVDHMIMFVDGNEYDHQGTYRH